MPVSTGVSSRFHEPDPIGISYEKTAFLRELLIDIQSAEKPTELICDLVQ